MQINLLICFKDKLKHLGITEHTEPGPGDVERGYLDELAEDKEAFVNELGAEETREDIEELGLVSEEVKLVNGDSVANFMLLEVSQYICQRRIQEFSVKLDAKIFEVIQEKS